MKNITLTKENRAKINALAEKICEAGERIANDNISKFCRLEHGRPDTIEIISDSGYEAIIIGNTGRNSKGYMMLYTKNTNKRNSYPSVKRIATLLAKVAKGIKLPEGEGKAAYMNWEEYGDIDTQMQYFSKIVCRMAGIEE